MSKNLGVELKTMSAYAHGINCIDINYCVADRILEMLIDQPNLSLDIALCWANMAKDSLQTHNSLSSYQLVLGANLKLPNIVYDKLPALEGVTIASLKHLQALHSAHKGYITAKSSERLRRAFRHKVRSAEKLFVKGDICHYK